MEISISNIKRITQKDVRKIQLLYQALSDNSDQIRKRYKEYPKENLVREVLFNLDCKVEDVLEIFINFLVFIQGIEYVRPKGEWYTLKIGNYLLGMYSDDNQEGGIKDNYKIVIR